jgi:hypothetical protein
MPELCKDNFASSLWTSESLDNKQLSESSQCNPFKMNINYIQKEDLGTQNNKLQSSSCVLRTCKDDRFNLKRNASYARQVFDEINQSLRDTDPNPRNTTPRG